MKMWHVWKLFSKDRYKSFIEQTEEKTVKAQNIMKLKQNGSLKLLSALNQGQISTENWKQMHVNIKHNICNFLYCDNIYLSILFHHLSDYLLTIYLTLY